MLPTGAMNYPTHSMAHSINAHGASIDRCKPVSPASADSESQLQQQRSNVKSGLTFADLPLEIREMIWTFALPEPRVFSALVFASVNSKMEVLNREILKMPLAHVCFESRRIVKEAGYILAFKDEDRPDNPGVWYHPHKDRTERTMWGPGDLWGFR
ncbi:hypothetical protein F5X99DRAFT_392543 [Biscogniauxia marginata]|nr:hypothetical protein F5X99DRAFT_392543 [Biscogniauxia marginata]